MTSTCVHKSIRKSELKVQIAEVGCRRDNEIHGWAVGRHECRSN